jgi:hypothetical protein
MSYKGISGGQAGLVLSSVRDSRTYNMRVSARVRVPDVGGTPSPFNALVAIGVTSDSRLWLAGIDGYGQLFGASGNYPIVTQGLLRVDAGGARVPRAADPMPGVYMPNLRPEYPAPYPLAFDRPFDIVVEVRQSGGSIEITHLVTLSQVVHDTFSQIYTTTTDELKDGEVGIACDGGGVTLDWFKLEEL